MIYGGERGPDLQQVALYHDLTPQEVIGFHTEPTYRVYTIGFAPGYPYLGEVLDAIATPVVKPSTLSPKGSVELPKSKPAFTKLIDRRMADYGWTPVKLFDPRWATAESFGDGRSGSILCHYRTGSRPMADPKMMEILSPGILTSIQDPADTAMATLWCSHRAGALDPFTAHWQSFALKPA